MNRKKTPPHDSPTGTAADQVAELKKELATLQERVARYHDVFDISPNALFLIGSDGRFVEANRSAIERYGYSMDEFRQMTPADLSVCEPGGKVLEQVGRALHESIQLESRHRCKDGRELPVEVRTKPAVVGGEACTFVVVQDISERKQAEEALRESQRRFRDVLENVLLFAVCLDLQGNILFINDYLLELTGWQRTEVIGRSWFDLFVPPGLPVRQMFEESVAANTIPAHHENDIITRLGEHRLVVWNNTALRDSQGQISGTASIGEDITDRRRAEEELRKSTTLLEQTFEQSPVPMALVSMPDTIIRIINPACREFLGLEGEPSYIGTPLPDYRPSFLDFDRDGNPGTVEDLPLARSLRGEKTVNEERRIIRKDGTTRWELASGAPIFDDLGQVIAGCLVMIDITERKLAEENLDRLNANLERHVEERTIQLEEAQEQLVRQERLAVLGKLAGGVGHELRNPLGVISNAIYYLKMIQPEAGPSVQEYLDILEQETRSAERIINDLLDFSRVTHADRQAVSVKEMVDATLTRFPAPAAIKVTRKFARSLPPAYVDPQQIVQVLGNLTVNAFQAMPAGGELRITTKPSATMIAISVTDTGAGIQPENMAKLFEPLFTTRPRGIGLGLAVSRKLVEANGGRIEAHSEAGRGSTFTVFLPARSE